MMTGTRCVALACALALVASAPAGATAGPAHVAQAATAGDVLFWSRLVGSHGYTIVKASVAAPTRVATVLAGPASGPHETFSAPEVSPDGSRLAYIRDAGRTTSLELRDLETGVTTVLASKTDLDEIAVQFSGPTWSPNNDTIAYTAIQTRAGREHPVVKVVSSFGVPSRTVDLAVAPAWRPDGVLTVARFDPALATTTGLWITGGTHSDAVLIPGTAGAHEHAWSPDGTQVVISRVTRLRPPTGPASLEILPASGGKATVLVPATTCNRAPAWSGDGRRVYFTQKATCAAAIPSQIKQVPRSGGNPSVVVTGGSNVSVSVTTMAAAPVPSRSRDFTGDGHADIIGRMPNGDLRLYVGDGLRLSGSRLMGTGWTGLSPMSAAGDFNGDGYPDVIGRTEAGYLYVFFGDRDGDGVGLSGYRLIGTGWGAMTAVFSPGDFDGDGHSDVIGQLPNGELWLYSGDGNTLTGSVRIGTGWGVMTAVFSPGDFDGDHHPDVIGRTSAGNLRVYFGTGTTLRGSAVISSGWGAMTAVFSPGDVNLDGMPDVIGRTPSGDLRVYFGNGTRLSGWRVIGTGWTGISPVR